MVTDISSSMRSHVHARTESCRGLDGFVQNLQAGKEMDLWLWVLR